MALHFNAVFPSSLRQIPAITRSELSNNNNGTISSSSSSLKWKILGPDHSNYAFTNSDHVFNNLSEKLKLYKQVFRNVGENSMRGLYMVDVMKRLNIDYHFHDEIDEFLENQYSAFSNDISGRYNSYDLHQTALLFRLLRQQGHHVPAEVFGKFMRVGMEGIRFNGDMKGMIDLYEASQLSIEGENILDEAEEFSGKMLRERIAYVDAQKAKFVRNTLEQPFHKSLAAFSSRSLLGDYSYGGMNGWLGAFRDVAKMDFNLVQSTHQMEILQVSKWWTELGLANELSCARDQPLKWYIWSLACLTDPSLSEQRIELTKPISFIYLLDDIFDIYGTLEQLTLFTEAVVRWDIEAMENLPDYMKICFRALDDLTNQISYNVYRKHGWNPIESLRNTWKRLCKAFLVEAKWFSSGKMPNAEEYLENGIVSSGVHVVLIHIFFLLGKGINQQTVNKIDKTPPIISSSATILRLWDDLGSAQDENQEGKDGSYMECMMKEEMSMESAKEVVMLKISDAWKSLNKECLIDYFPSQFTKASLNLARMVPLMYSYDENQCLPRLEQQVKSLLYDPLPL